MNNTFEFRKILMPDNGRITMAPGEFIVGVVSEKAYPVPGRGGFQPHTKTYVVVAKDVTSDTKRK